MKFIILLLINLVIILVQINEEYYHKFNLDLTSYNIGDIIYLKIYVKDDVNPVTEIPSNGSPFTFLRHFTIKII